MVSCNTAAEQVSFDIPQDSSTDSEVITALHVSKIDSGSESAEKSNSIPLSFSCFRSQIQEVGEKINVNDY